MIVAQSGATLLQRVSQDANCFGILFVERVGLAQQVHDRQTIGIRLLNLSERKREQLAMLMEELDKAERRERGADDGPRPEAG